MLTKLIESHTALFNVLCDLPIPVRDGGSCKHALAVLAVILIAIILIDKILFAVIWNAVIKIAVTLIVAILIAFL